MRDKGEHIVVANKINIIGGFDNTSCIIMDVNVNVYVTSYPKCAHYHIQQVLKQETENILQEIRENQKSIRSFRACKPSQTLIKYA